MNEDDGRAEAVAWFGDPEMRAWLENNSFKLITDYVQRGRVHRELSNEALIEAWAENMKKHCRNPGDRSIFCDQNDFDAELELRNLEIPLERVKDDIEIRRQYFARLIEDMKTNPEDWREFSEALKEDLVDFLVELEELKERRS